MSDMLRVDALGKRFGEHVVLKDVSFSLPAGASLAVIGPSGCGKSTLLSIIASLTPAGSGSVAFSRGKPYATIWRSLSSLGASAEKNAPAP